MTMAQTVAVICDVLNYNDKNQMRKRIQAQKNYGAYLSLGRLIVTFNCRLLGVNVTVDFCPRKKRFYFGDGKERLELPIANVWVAKYSHMAKTITFLI